MSLVRIHYPRPDLSRLTDVDLTRSHSSGVIDNSSSREIIAAKNPPCICQAIFAQPGHSQVAPVNSLVRSLLGLGCGHRLYLTIDLKERGSCVHSVENRKRHGQVDHNDPGFKAKDNLL